MRYEITGAQESPFIIERDSPLKIGDTVSSPNGDNMYRVDEVEQADDTDAIAYVSFHGRIG